MFEEFRRARFPEIESVEAFQRKMRALGEVVVGPVHIPYQNTDIERGLRETFDAVADSVEDQPPSFLRAIPDNSSPEIRPDDAA